MARLTEVAVTYWESSSWLAPRLMERKVEKMRTRGRSGFVYGGSGGGVNAR